MVALAEQLPDQAWPSLEELGLSYTRARGGGLKALGRALDRGALPKLKEITYKGNPTPTEAKREFAAALVREAKRKKAAAQESLREEGEEDEGLEEKTIAFMRVVKTTMDPAKLGHSLHEDVDDA